jgi:hypothetical protein
MHRLRCLLIALILLTIGSCSEPQHLLGEPCVDDSQCKSNYCQQGLCSTPNLVLSDASTDATSDAPDSSEASVDSPSDAPDSSDASDSSPDGPVEASAD